MSHELTISTTGAAEMAYAGKTPWHGLGQRLDPSASIEAWRKAAGMDWEIHRGMVSTEALVQHDGVMVSTQIDVPDRVVLFRSDNLKPLSVVSRRYQEVQPAQALEFFRDMAEAGGFEMHTAGTLMGGKRMWALVKTGDAFELPGHDVVESYILLATSCDGTLATTVRETSVRVVCNNTLTAALRDGSKCVNVRHSTKFDPERAKASLRRVSESFNLFASTAEKLTKIRIDAEKASRFVASVLPNIGGGKIEESRGYQEILRLFNGAGRGATLESSQGTAWGLLNSITEYVDHHTRARSQDSRLASAWFGIGETIKSESICKLEKMI